jgi:hypothetical protein
MYTSIASIRSLCLAWRYLQGKYAVDISNDTMDIRPIHTRWTEQAICNFMPRSRPRRTYSYPVSQKVYCCSRQSWCLDPPVFITAANEPHGTCGISDSTILINVSLITTMMGLPRSSPPPDIGEGCDMCRMCRARKVNTYIATLARMPWF